jgi:hypothetical protein
MLAGAGVAMKVIAPVLALGRDEHGGTLVMVAVWLPLLVLVAAFVVDVGHWFAHKRHLQMQADAGALAGGGVFIVPCTGAVDDRIAAEARKYAGDPEVAGAYNSQVNASAPANVHVLINSSAFWDEGGTSYSDGGTPCATEMLDVRLTETDPPRFFGPLVPAINARARIEIRALETPSGLLPIGVPEVNPKVVAATFYDDDTGHVLARVPLTPSADIVSAGTTLKGWSSAPATVPIGAKHIGVRIALGGGTSTDCGAPNVDCYDDVNFLRGAPARPGTPADPTARDVWLSGADSACPDPYFAPLTTGSCAVTVNADVDFGVDPKDVNAAVTARVGKRDYPLGYDAGARLWRGTATVPAAAGPVEVELTWADTCGPKAKKCSDSFDDPKDAGDYVQRAFTADEELAGPLKLVEIARADGSFGVNSFPLGSSPSLIVSIGVESNLRNAASVSEPPVHLRVFKETDVHSASRNRSLDCDPGYTNFWEELAYGCNPQYAKHDLDTPCPSTQTSLWRSTQPWTCVAVDTGARRNQLAKGLNVRVFGTDKPSSCTAPNNWSSFPNLPPGDPRIIFVFITPFSAFRSSGSGTVPATEFATFYATGWDAAGSGFDNPCQGQGDDPAPAGFLVGHFIKYVSPLNNGGAADELCDFDAFGSCVAVLTR